MKKITKAIICTIIMAILIMPTVVFGADSPVLESVSFTNAKIDEDFSSDKLEYGLTLDDPSKSPTLESYKTKGTCEMFVTYIEDDAKHQTGICVALEYEDGKTEYKFNYTNPLEYEVNSNNFLKSLECEFGEVYPELNHEETNYKLYVPSDLTELNINAIPEDKDAICEVPKQIVLSPNQESVITITVTASDASQRVYSFRVKRLKMDSTEAKEEMGKSNFSSLVDEEFIYKQPEFWLIIAGGIVGLIILIIIIAKLRKAVKKPTDDDEEDFFIIDMD